MEIITLMSAWHTCMYSPTSHITFTAFSLYTFTKIILAGENYIDQKFMVLIQKLSSDHSCNHITL